MHMNPVVVSKGKDLCCFLMMRDIEYFTDLKAHVVFILDVDYLLVVIQNEQTLRYFLKIILYVIVIGLKSNDPAS